MRASAGKSCEIEVKYFTHHFQLRSILRPSLSQWKFHKKLPYDRIFYLR